MPARGAGAFKRIVALSPSSIAPLPTAANPLAEFFTNFPATENPLSQGGLWVRGLTEGLSWNNPQTASNSCYGSTINAGGAPSGPPFDDNLAHLKPSLKISPLNHRVEQTLFIAGGYTPPVPHEVEILLRFDISANNARGYEVTFSLFEQMIHVVRWNGALNDFTDLVLDIAQTFADNDVVGAQISGNTISVDVNGTVKGTVSDTTWSSGQPGLGYWARSGATLSSFGSRNFRALSLA
jgi:hypothetical protein